MFRKHLLSLSSITRDQYKTFRTHDQINVKPVDYAHVRQQITQFLLFLRDGFMRYLINLCILETQIPNQY